jgi:hypothetical protein
VGSALIFVVLALFVIVVSVQAGMKHQRDYDAEHLLPRVEYRALKGYDCNPPRPTWMPETGEEISLTTCTKEIHGPLTKQNPNVEIAP